jgi:glucan 1,3-beta-glucosidase
MANGAFFDGTAPGTKGGRSCSGKTGNAATFSTAMKNAMRQHWEAQVNSFEAAAGWIAWTWKTEAGRAEEWSYQKGVQYGWIPKNPTERKYANPCNTVGLERLP